MKKYKHEPTGREFDTISELGCFAHKYNSDMRKKSLGRNQLLPIPKNIPKNYKIKKTDIRGNSIRMTLTGVIPLDWLYVKIYEPVKVEPTTWEPIERVWICIEPVEIENDREQQSE